MKSRLILPVAAAAIALAASSCTPWVEPNPPMPPGGDPAARNMQPDPGEQAHMKEKRDRMKQKNEEARDRENSGDDGQNAGPGESQGRKETAPPGDEPAEKPKEKLASVPTAVKVPGKPGMVFSPFNNKLVDVVGIPSGKLVRDPTYPVAEKKIFRVP